MSVEEAERRASVPGTDARRWSRIEAVVACTDLDAMVAWFTTEVGLRIETISPADDPATYVLTGRGITVRVVRSDQDVPVSLVARVPAEHARASLTAPNGSTIAFIPDGLTIEVPANDATFSLVRSGDGFGIGRAGMEYRDLLPGRAGGRFIASHIRIPGGGDVADSVHFHRIRFQMIFCARGWVDLVYEDQGEPFRLEAGDCVLQPPEIRHRVLRSSPGLEVIEIGCPAEHDTFIEHVIELPTPTVDPARDFGGQRFVRHVAEQAARGPWLIDGLVVRDTGIGDATDGLAAAVVIAVSRESSSTSSVDAPESPIRSRPISRSVTHGAEFVVDVVLDGAADLSLDDGTRQWVERVAARDAVAYPPGMVWGWSDWTDDFEVLEVSLPAGAVHRTGDSPD